MNEGKSFEKVIGTFSGTKSFAYVVPDDFGNKTRKSKREVFIPKKNYNGAKNGMKVVAEITKWHRGRLGPEGKVIELLGFQGEPSTAVRAIMRNYGINEIFPDEAQEEAKNIPQNVSQEEIAGRLDRRELKIITIDGDDSKDFDDAVYAKKTTKGWRLGVYIADVSHYVREGSPLDAEAEKRGTSVYLPGQVIPMLPFELSNGICSLKEGEDRLVIACEMDLDKDANVMSHMIASAVIRVYRRLTYRLANEILEGHSNSEYQSDLLPMLKELAMIRKKRRAVRFARGAIEFNIPEIKILTDETGRPAAVEKRAGTLSESIIEECMLIANESVAKYLSRRNVPFISRVHEPPEAEKIEFLNAVLAKAAELHIAADNGETSPESVQKILMKSKGHPKERLINMAALRSMRQARYDLKSIGHFALAAKYYAHFTSPIRRYPDLTVHQVISELLRAEKLQKDRIKSLKARLFSESAHSSERERAAASAERDVTDMFVAEYMARFVGETFQAVITGVTSFGIFVGLENGAEGLVHISNMKDDYYDFNEEEFTLTGERTGKKYSLGDEVSVALTRSDWETREIDFELKEETPDPARQKKPRGFRRIARKGGDEHGKEKRGRKIRRRKQKGAS